MEVNYKKVSRYDTKKMPRVPSRAVVWLEYMLARLTMPKVPYKITKLNMEGIKEPFILLSNHLHFVDFKLTAAATYPLRLCNVVSLDGYYHRPWIMEMMGSMAKRKFTNDITLVRQIKSVLDSGCVLSMYPEARYTPIGTSAILPDSLGKMCKLMDVPVVAMIHHGNYLHTPFWDYRRQRKVPLHSVMKCILTPQQLRQLTADEINGIIRSQMAYDEYEYQQREHILITEPFAAEGLHKVLYQCPSCCLEGDMASEGTRLFCRGCKKSWELCPDGSLRADDGEDIFSRVPDWFEWQRAQVREQLLTGKYSFAEDCELYSLPSTRKFHKLGRARVTHGDDGFIIEGFYNNRPILIRRPPLSMYGLHVEYDFAHVKKGEDCIEINTEEDSYYCFFDKKNSVTKLSFATEELYKIKSEEKRASARREQKA